MVCSSCVVLGNLANTGGTASYVSLGSIDAPTLFLGGENDLHASMPAAFAFVVALMGWPSCFAMDSPAVFAARLLRYAALSGFLRRLGFGAPRAVAAIFQGLLAVVSRVVCRVAGRARDVSGSCYSQQHLELSIRVGRA